MQRLFPRRPATGKPRVPRGRLELEFLEDRLAPAVFNVNTTADLSIAAGVNPNGTIVGQGNTITLRSAIQAANANTGGNTINLTVPGTYAITQLGTPGETDNLKGEFSIFPTTPNGNLSIINTSGGTAIVDGGGQNRVFDINASNNTATPIFLVTMQGFTIQNGRASPGDGAAGSGGGIREQGTQSLTLTSMVVSNNTATADGGGLVMFNTVNPATSWVLTINASTISNNHAGDAGGGIDTDGAGTVFINSGTVITGNTDIHQGAGVYIDVAAGNPSPIGATMTMTGTVVSNNSALAGDITASGGGISNAGNATMTIAICTIANNFTGGQGGGFSDENNNGTLIVSNSIFQGNTATMNGGGIQEGGPSTKITDTLFLDNNSGATGAALFANGTTVSVSSSTFAANTASIGGGAIELETTGTGASASTITNSTITGNSALNNAGANGGGIDASAAFTGAVTLLNDTINGNFADNGGGVFWAGTAGSVFNVENTIIARNTASTTGPDANNPAGSFTDLGGNLIGISGAGSGNTGFGAASQTGTVVSPLDPLLAALSKNGGPTIGAPGTQETLQTEALLLGSPALDKGVAAGAPTTDQRGFPRPDAGAAELPDVGAFEFQDVSLTVSITPLPSTVTVGNTETLSVTVTNTSGNALPADNSTLTVTLPSGLTAAGPLTFAIGSIPAHGSATFNVTTTAAGLGSQTVTATVTSPDANPASASTSATITVQNATPTPVGALTGFALAFGPGFALNLFSVDTQGNVFMQPFSVVGSMGTPVFVNSMVQLASAMLQNNQVFAVLNGTGGQTFFVNIFNFFNPFVFSAVLAALGL
jgi:hypothetical protein